MSNYRRIRVPGGCYFFTVNLLERKSNTLLVDHIDLFRDAVRQTRKQHPFHIDAWVVLPEHMHCVWTLPLGDEDYSNRWWVIKQRFSRALPNTEHRSSTRIKRNERGIWQRRFWAHWITHEQDYAAHVDYCHWNPMKHGLVQRLADWPYSSFHRFVQVGVLDEHWAGTSDLNQD
jgi:putative transposase